SFQWPHTLVFSRIRIRAAARVSLFVFGCVGALAVATAIAMWTALAWMGVIDHFEGFAADLFGVKSLDISASAGVVAVVLLVIAGVVVGVLVIVMLALLYNVMAKMTGGIEVTAVERLKRGTSANSNGGHHSARTRRDHERVARLNGHEQAR